MSENEPIYAHFVKKPTTNTLEDNFIDQTISVKFKGKFLLQLTREQLRNIDSMHYDEDYYEYMIPALIAQVLAKHFGTAIVKDYEIESKEVSDKEYDDIYNQHFAETEGKKEYFNWVEE